MLNYTDAITALMGDIVRRVPALAFIDLSQVLVFARYGRIGAEGPYATCHSMNLPTSEPGYYFWKDRDTGEVTRRSEWFVTKSPSVVVNGARVNYLISFALPRFCEQTLEKAHKTHRYWGRDPWLAKLDTVVHELYHIDPDDSGIRRMVRHNGEEASRCHSPEFFREVATLVDAYMASGPDEAAFDFLRHDFATLTARYGTIVGTTFRGFPSYPQRYPEPLCTQPEAPPVTVVPVPARRAQPDYTERDLCLRVFTDRGSRRLDVPVASSSSTSLRQPAAAADAAR
jgi:hypothetical protein